MWNFLGAILCLEGGRHVSVQILIVEDDKEIARIVCDHLRREQYDVTWASTGNEGWEDFQKGSYQLVIVDLMLPEMDGFTLVHHIRLKSDVPILIISAKNREDPFYLFICNYLWFYDFSC